jgi:hypothetical protein
MMVTGTLRLKSGADGKARVSAGPMDFSGALRALKAGAKVARAGWGGQGSFLFMVPGTEFHVSRAPLLGIFPRGKKIRYRPRIDLVCEDGVMPWNASHADLLESDWIAMTPPVELEGIGTARTEAVAAVG